MTNLFNRNDGTFAQVDYASISGVPSAATLSFVTGATTADIALTSGSSTTFSAGPTVTQGSSGIWWASGDVTFISSGSALPQVFAKLWDGTTVIDSGASKIAVAGTATMISLNGIITSPSSNIKISVSSNSTAAFLVFNFSGLSLDSSLVAVRIG